MFSFERSELFLADRVVRPRRGFLFYSSAFAYFRAAGKSLVCETRKRTLNRLLIFEKGALVKHSTGKRRPSTHKIKFIWVQSRSSAGTFIQVYGTREQTA